jgi:hypothetical protein
MRTETTQDVGEDGGGEGDGEEGRHLDALVMDIVLDDHLQPELGVEEGREHEEDDEARIERRLNQSAHSHGGPRHAHGVQDEPEDKEEISDRGDALRLPVAGAERAEPRARTLRWRVA